MKRRLITGTAVVAFCVLGITGALASWAARGQGTATAKATTLSQGSMSTVTADSTTSLKMNLVWAVSGVTGASPAVSADGYHVRRYSVASGGTPTDVCGSTAAAPITGTSCSDTAPNTNPVWYAVTPHYLTWSGLESARVQGTPTTISTSKLVITSAAVSGATSSTPNLGQLTVQRQNSAGTPLTPATALTVNLSSSSAGGTFSVGTGQQFSTTTVTSISIAANASSATFWYGDTSAGTPTITAAATSFTAGTQVETITAAPAGLAMSITGGSGTPLMSCGTISSAYSCNVTNTGSSGNVIFSVKFVSPSGVATVYSGTQASSLAMTGNNTGTATVAANATTSTGTLTASHSGSSTKTSTVQFGPYSLIINVS